MNKQDLFNEYQEERIEGALYMASLGFRVFPVAGKAPTVKYTEKATTDADLITKALSRKGVSGYGYMIGEDHILLDADNLAALRVFQTYGPTLTITTGRGEHRLYRLPENVKVKNGKDIFPEESYDIDIKTGNGYAIGPGSLHFDKGTQEYTGDMYSSWLDEEISVLINDHLKIMDRQSPEDTPTPSNPPIPVNDNFTAKSGMTWENKGGWGSVKIPDHIQEMLDTPGDTNRKSNIIANALLRLTGDIDLVVHTLVNSVMGKGSGRSRSYFEGQVESNIDFIGRSGGINKSEHAPEIVSEWLNREAQRYPKAMDHKALKAIADYSGGHLEFALSGGQLGILSSTSRQAAQKRLKKFVENGTLVIVSAPEKMSKEAIRYSIPTPTTDLQTARAAVGELPPIPVNDNTIAKSSLNWENADDLDASEDQWFWGAYVSWFSTVAALLDGALSSQEITAKTGRSQRRESEILREMLFKGLLLKEKRTYRLKEDYAERLANLVAGTRFEGKGQRNAEAYAEEVRKFRERLDLMARREDYLNDYGMLGSDGKIYEFKPGKRGNLLERLGQINRPEGVKIVGLARDFATAA